MKVYLIGAGPGDPGLFTVRGREILASADVIVYDALANAELLTLAKPAAELIYVGKTAGRHAMPQEEINQLLVAKAREKGTVARLKGGDPYIFGRGGEEAEYLYENGTDFEEVPGVSSAIAAPAYAGIPLTHRDFVSSVLIITGHEKPEKEMSSHNWRAYAQCGSTLVFVMGMKNLPYIAYELIKAGIDPEIPGAVIYRGTTPAQRCVTAPLKNLAEEAARAGLTNPAVIVVGKVAGLSSRLNWYDRRPLSGRKIVVTRAREQASEMRDALAELGAQVLECPSIRIEPLVEYEQADAAIRKLGEYSWIIFTSANGVRIFWERLGALGFDSRIIGRCKVAAIGPGTAQALLSHGISADLLPDSYVAESVVASLRRLEGDNLKNMRVLIPRAARARNALPEGLSDAGAAVDVVPLYATVPAAEQIGEVCEAVKTGTLDCVTFASASTVDNFFAALVQPEILRGSGVKLAAIGPITAKALRRYGFEPDIQPEIFTIPRLIQAIVKHFATESA